MRAAAGSTLARHVHSVAITRIEVTNISADARTTATHEPLGAVQVAFTQLQSLIISDVLMLPADPNTPLPLPSKLRRLDLWDVQWPSKTALLAAPQRPFSDIANQCPLLTHLMLFLAPLDVRAIHALDFSPLLTCARLCNVEINFVHSQHVPDSLINTLRRMPALESVKVNEGDIDQESVVRLLQPQPLQWKRMQVKEVTDSIAALLPQLPQLTWLRPLTWRVTDLSFLARMPALQHLALQSGSVRTLPVEMIVAAVSSLKHLPYLEVPHEQLNADHFVAMLQPSVPFELYMDCCPQVKSLRFLSTNPALVRHCTSLSLMSSEHAQPPWRMPMEEAAHIHALKQLHALDFYQLFEPPLSEELKPGTPQCVLPLMTSFQCYDACE